MDPVGGLVTGPPKAISFHKSFQKMNGMVVSPDPIGRDPFGIEGEHLRCQALHRNPGKHEEAGIVDHHGEVFHFCGLVPTDELFSGLDSPGSRPPSKTSDGAFAKESDVFEMAANDLPVAEVMIASDEAVIEGLERRVAGEMERDRGEVPKLSRNRRLVYFDRRDASVTFVVVGAGKSGGKRDEALSLEGQKDLPAGHVFEAAVGLEPSPFAAQDPGDPCASLSPVVFDSCPDLGYDSRSNRSFSDGQRFHNHRIAEPKQGRHKIVHGEERFFSSR
jgi:hypothetical protein